MSLTSVTSDSSCLNRLLKQPPTPCFTDNSVADSLARWHPLDWRCPARSRKVVMSSTNSAFSAKEHSLNPSTMQFFHNGGNQPHWIFDKEHSLVRTNAVGILLQITSVRRGYGCWTSAWQGFATARIADNDSCAHCSTWSNSLRLMPLRTSWWQSTRTQRKQFHRMRNRALLIRARQNRDAEWN